MLGLRCHFISMPGKSPMKLEVTSRHDHSCLLGRKASKQTNKQNYISKEVLPLKFFSVPFIYRFTLRVWDIDTYDNRLFPVDVKIGHLKRTVQCIEVKSSVH